MSNGVRVPDLGTVSNAATLLAVDETGSVGQVPATNFADGAQLSAVSDQVSTIAGDYATDTALAIERARIDGLSQIQDALVLVGNWNASGGAFPTSTTAGEYWITETAGTVDGVAFAIGDKVIALVDAASTTTFAGNWSIDKTPPADLTPVTDVLADKRALYVSQTSPNLIPSGAARWTASASVTDLSDTAVGGVPAIHIAGPASSSVNAAFDLLRDAAATDVTFSLRLLSKTGGTGSFAGRLIVYEIDEAYGTGTSGATVLATTVAQFPSGTVSAETDVSATVTLNAATSRLVLAVDLQAATDAVFSLATAGWGAVTGYRLPESRPDDILTGLQWPLLPTMARRRWVGAIRADTDAISTGTRWFIDGTNLTISVAENAIRMFDGGETINDLGAWEVTTAYTATSTSASSAGAVISVGAGAARRHYVYLRNGYLGVLDNANAVIEGAVAAAPYDLSERVGLRLFRGPDGAGYIEATDPDGTTTRRSVTGIPTGKVYAASRANATCEIHHLTVAPVASAVADVDTRVTALETLAGLADTVPLGYTVLPNFPAARDTDAYGFGFTSTGLDRWPEGTTYAGCWLVGDDGRMIEGDGTPLAGKVHILSPDARTILQTYDFGEVSSVQGVTCLDDDTFWVCVSGLKEIRHYNIAGTLLATLEWDTLGYTGDPNGLAWDDANAGLWVTIASSATARLLLASDGSLLDTLTLATSSPDQLHYDGANGLLYASTGANGVAGTVHVHRVSTDAAVGSYASLRHAQAIEGIYLDRDTGTLTLTNDGQFHDVARPALNMMAQYRVSLFD